MDTATTELLDLDRIINLDDVEALALTRLDPVVAAYLLGGAGDEETLRDNRAAYSRYRLRPRIGEGGGVCMTTTLLGREVSMPVGIAPSAAHGYFCDDGEAATATAAAAAGALYCASSASSRPVEEIARAADTWWYQCYPLSGAAGLGRAAELGYHALVLTVDVPVAGHRDREFRSERAHPRHPMYDGAWGYARPGFDLSSHSHRTRVTWPDIRRLIAESDVPIVLKGVVTAEDAVMAGDAGAAAVWVSNHGGRQLDRAIATLDALPEVVDAVGGDLEVYVDGGVRRGVDVAVALALGARAVFVGRAPVLGLAAGGVRGATVVLEQLRKELENALSLLGVNDPAALDRSAVRAAGS
ncbi:MAG: alpha-hydroxy acid oxidase [Microbacterium sp.]